MLELLASQAAISLENAGLYSDLRQSESELRQSLDFAPQHVYVLGRSSSMRLYVNQAALDYHGLAFEEWRTCDLRKLFHPDDWERSQSGAQGEIAAGIAHEVEIRLRRKDGKIAGFFPAGTRCGTNTDA